MHIQHNDLRVARKRSQLTQSDVAFILGLSDYNTVSKWEKGAHRPTLDSLLSYHLLFDVPIESFFDIKKMDILKTIIQQIPTLIERIRSSEVDERRGYRIAFLQKVAAKLSEMVVV